MNTEELREEVLIIGNTIFQKEKNKLRIVECYYHEHLCYGIEKISKECIAIFDHNEEVLNKIITGLQSGMNIILAYNRNIIIYRHGAERITLAKYLYCMYKGIDLDSPEVNSVWHKTRKQSKNIENCMSDNLYTGTANIVIEDNCLVVSSNAKGYKDVFEPDEVLADILQSDNIILEWNSFARLMCTIKDGFIFPVADLAFLSYYGNLTVNNYKEKLAKLKQHKVDNGLSIEHLDSDFHNHFKYNIALVPEGLNSRKNDKILRIKEPHCFAIVNSNGKYKILVGYLDNDWMLRCDKLFITEHFETVVDLLDIYIEEYPENINKEYALKNNNGLFRDRAFCRALAITPDEHFKDLDALCGN